MNKNSMATNSIDKANQFFLEIVQSFFYSLRRLCPWDWENPSWTASSKQLRLRGCVIMWYFQKNTYFHSGMQCIAAYVHLLVTNCLIDLSWVKCRSWAGHQHKVFHAIQFEWKLGKLSQQACRTLNLSQTSPRQTEICQSPSNWTFGLGSESIVISVTSLTA